MSPNSKCQEEASTVPRTCREISGMDRHTFADFLDSFDTVLSDCDGVLYSGEKALPGSADFLNRMHADWERKVVYVTNNSVKTREQTVDKLLGLDFPTTMDNTFHAGYLTALYLKNLDFRGKAYVVGGDQAITHELKNLGIDYTCNKIDTMPSNMTLEYLSESMGVQDPDVNCVIVGLDYHLSYLKIMKATNYLMREDSLFLATDHDAVFPILGGTSMPAAGPLASAIELASGRSSVVCGKPSPFAFANIRSAHPDITADRTLMIGDRADSDILLGTNCGLKTLLVGSGITSLEDVRAFEAEGRQELVPDFYAASLGEVLQVMEKFGL